MVPVGAGAAPLLRGAGQRPAATAPAAPSFPPAATAAATVTVRFEEFSP